MSHKKKYKTLRLIFADQLSIGSSLIKEASQEHDVFLFCEVDGEINYTSHHTKKVIFLLSAMRHFSELLQEKGYAVCYIKHDDPKNTQSFEGEIKRAIKKFEVETVEYILPGEYRVKDILRKIEQDTRLPFNEHEDIKFIVNLDDFKTWKKNKKSLLMESFYRENRKQYNILMDKDKPEGGEWNYDKSNRKTPPKEYSPKPPLMFEADEITSELIQTLSTKLNKHIGDAQGFHFAVTRKQALAVLRYFIDNNLNHFGDYQDAMLEDEPWMTHSHISFYLNIGLLTPMECIEQAIKAYQKKKVAINNAEGFVRQILGWREYIRGIYWSYMPDYQSLNFLDASRDLPALFWSGKTRMNCLSQCVGQTINEAYAHHIQRLMVIGNFCLLAGIDPKQVQDWYLAVYADAFEWVELPNVQGMILYADGGIMASKPYAASGAYINKMSNYCKGCSYNVNKKTGEKACPFNYLYWCFMDKNKEKLKSNHRLRFPYKQLEKFSDSQLSAIKESAESFLDDLE